MDVFALNDRALPVLVDLREHLACVIVVLEVAVEGRAPGSPSESEPGTARRRLQVSRLRTRGVFAAQARVLLGLLEPWRFLDLGLGARQPRLFALWSGGRPSALS